MDFLQELAARRQQYLDGLDANRDDINLDIFGDFYPDRAHFIYELLQNAEDVGATEADIRLTPSECWFTHNGRREFTEGDVRAITGIHNSTKTKSSDQIGKFGIGFKSVFVYTINPQVHSGPFAFQISRLVLPEEIKSIDDLANRTRFVLPLGTPKKSAVEAFDEIQGGLEELPPTTLLFLRNLRVVRWHVDGRPKRELLCIDHPDNHVEALIQSSGKVIHRSHYLRFSKPVDSISELESLHLSVAFELDYLPSEVPPFDPARPLAKQLKMVQATPGQVAVFFPAKSEKSNLFFHVHAPFVPTLDRASIKDVPANGPLVSQLGTLAAEALHSVRRVGC